MDKKERLGSIFQIFETKEGASHRAYTMNKSKLRDSLDSLRINRSYLYALLPSALFMCLIFTTRWIPIHDTFQFSQITHYIFSESVLNGHLPLWYPYMMYGLDTNWYLAFTMGPSLVFLLPFAKLFPHVNFLNFLYLSFFIDELILFTGSYLLARQILGDKLSAGYVALTVAGSTLWHSQVWFNLHLFYMMPMALYFLLRGIKEASLWRVMAAGFVMAVGFYGNLPYFPPLQALFMSIIAVALCWTYRRTPSDIVNGKTLKDTRVWFFLLLLAFLAIGYVVLNFYGVDHINYNVGREKNNTVDMWNFLDYGTGSTLFKLSEAFTGTTWSLDVSFYAGILAFALAVFGLIWRPDREQLPWLAGFLFVMLFSLGGKTVVAPLTYYFPGMNYFRHVGLTTPIAKMFLILLSGFGLKQLMSVIDGGEEGDKKEALKIMIYILSGMAFVCAVLMAVIVLGRKFYFVPYLTQYSLDMPDQPSYRPFNM